MSHLGSAISFFVRELRISLSSRMLLVMPAAGFAAGLAAVFAAPAGQVATAGPLFLMQVLLYALPLTAILLAESSCHSEADEQALLATLPVCRGARVLGKFAGLMTAMLAGLVLMVAPLAVAGGATGSAALLLGYGVGAAMLSTAIGMLCGLVVRDGVKAHMTALLLWLLLTVGAGAVGYFTLGTDVTNAPDLWAGMLMLSPLDALRIGVLFSVEPVPFALERLPVVSRLWLENPGAWYALLTLLWTVPALALAARASRRVQ